MACRPSASSADPSAEIPRVGWLSLRGPGEQDNWLGAFEDGLRVHGYEPGQTVSVEYRFAHGDKYQFARLVGELLHLPVDVLASTDANALGLARDATVWKPIPIVMVGINDPVGRGLVASLARPGGNITGLGGFAGDLDRKRPELLRAAIPSMSRVAILVASSPNNGAPEPTRLSSLAGALGLEAIWLEVSSEDGLPAALEAAAAQADALLVEAHPLFRAHTRRIVALAAAYGIPATYPDRAFVDAGGLMYAGRDYADLVRRAGAYAARILGGANPADLPVEQTTRVELFINVQAARDLRLAIPSAVLEQATLISP
jgi:putative ABC transport system substrate-binding protein